MAVLHVHLFGGLELVRDGRSLAPIPGTAARSLFAYLVTYRDRHHTRNLLAGTFWPDQADASARRRLSHALWQIGRAVGDELFLTEGDTVQIDPDLPLWVDVEAFGKLEGWAAGKREASGVPACRPSDLIDLYRGEFLAGYYDDWVLFERERLRELFLAALSRLVDECKQEGDYERALLHARRLASEDPWSEEAHREVMRLCHVLGRDAEALKQYEVCCQVLKDEFDVAPQAETAALAAEIAHVHADEKARQADVDTVPYLPQAAPAPSLIAGDDAGLMPAPLVGRHAERAALVAHVEAAINGLGGVVLVEGQAGVGKTRLLQEVARDAEWRDVQVLWGHSRERGSATPFAPWVEALTSALSPLRVEQWAHLVEPTWLQVLRPLLPALGTIAPDPPPPVEPERERQRLVSAFAELLSAWSRAVPLLVLLEDLHRADDESIELLAELGPSLRAARVLIAGSYRGDEARARPAVWERLQTVYRTGQHERLALAPLGAGGTGELIRRSLRASDAAPLFEARIFQETGGNPLFILESLRVLWDEGLLSVDTRGQWGTPWDETTESYAELPLPPAVEQVIARRVAQLAPEVQAVLQMAAVLDGGFDFCLLQTACGGDAEQILPAVHTLVRRHFLVERPAAYEFDHDQIRHVVYQSLATEARRDAHRQAASALESLRPEQAATLAHHCAQGAIWKRAAGYYTRAGDQAREMYANDQALEHYARALDAMGRQPDPPEPDQVFAVHLKREAIYDLLCDRAAQAQEHEVLAELVRRWPGDEREARLALRRATFLEETGDYDAAATAAQAALEPARRAGAVELEARALAEWGRTLWRKGTYEAARVQFEHVLRLTEGGGLDAVRAGGASALRADALNNLGNCHLYEGNYAEARAYYQRTLPLHRALGNREGEGKVLYNLGYVEHDLGNLAGAVGYYEQALDIFRQIGNRRGEGTTLMILGLAWQHRGDYGTALDHYEQAVRIAVEVEDQLGEANATANVGMIRMLLGEYDTVEPYFEQTMRLHRKSGDQRGEGATLNSQALFCCLTGRHAAAETLARQAIANLREIGDRFYQSSSYIYLGHALGSQGQWDAAADAYRQAVALRNEMGEPHAEMEPLAGLARALLACGDLDAALVHAGQILHHLACGNPHTAEEPVRVYLTCYQVLSAAGDPRAGRTLEAAHAFLAETAARIADAGVRRAYLENVATHRELAVRYREWQEKVHGRRESVRLPRAGAPAGRQPHDDELVPVTWTPEAPEDEAVRGKTERRQQRLLRLVREAAEQGAAPSIDDLARALDVSRATVKRDLSALRAAGREVQTRGSLFRDDAQRSSHRDTQS